MFGRSLVKQAAAPALRSIAAKRTITTSPIALSDKLFVVNRSSSGPDSPKRKESRFFHTLGTNTTGDLSRHQTGIGAALVDLFFCFFYYTRTTTTPAFITCQENTPFPTTTTRTNRLLFLCTPFPLRRLMISPRPTLFAPSFFSHSTFPFKK